MRWICRGYVGPATVDTTRSEVDTVLAYDVAVRAKGQPEKTNFEPAGEGATARATAAIVAAELNVTPAQAEAGVEGDRAAEDDTNWL